MSTIVNQSAINTGSFGASPRTITIPFTVTAGNSLIATIGFNGTFPQGLRVTDNASNVYVLDNDDSANPYVGTYTFRCPRVYGSPTTLSLSWTNSVSNTPVVSFIEVNDAGTRLSTTPNSVYGGFDSSDTFSFTTGVDSAFFYGFVWAFTRTLSVSGEGATVFPSSGSADRFLVTSTDVGVAGSQAINLTFGNNDHNQYPFVTLGGTAAASLANSSTSYLSNWTHTPVATASGIIVQIWVSPAAETVSSVTYGGVSMTQVATAAVPVNGRGYVFTLANPPAGAQTIAVTATNEWWAIATTVIGGSTSSVLESVTSAYDAGGDQNWSISITIPSGRTAYAAWMTGNNSGDSVLSTVSPASILQAYGTASRWLIATHSNTASSIGWTSNNGGGYYSGEAQMFAGLLVEAGPPEEATQAGFRGYADGTQSGSAPLQAENTNFTVALDTIFQTRFLVNSTFTTSVPFTPRLQFAKNGGAWTTVPVGPTIPGVGTQAITFVGRATGTGNGASYSVSLTSLTGGSGSAAAAGDLVLVVTGWASVSDGAPGVTSPAGYVQLQEGFANDTRDANLDVSYKIMGATPDTSVTVSGPNNTQHGGATIVLVYRNIDASTPIDVTTPAPATNFNASRANAPSITPANTGSMVVACMMSTGDTTPTAFTGPANMTNFAQQAHAGTSMSAIVSAAHTSSTTAGVAFDPDALTGGETSTSDSWVGITVALRGAPNPPTNNEIFVAASTNIATGGEATTARLVPPVGKTTSDFVVGRIWDDENNSDSFNVTANDYTEVAWSLEIQSPAVNGDYYDLRVTNSTFLFDNYDQVPRVTVGTSQSYSVATTESTTATDAATVLGTYGVSVAEASVTSDVLTGVAIRVASLSEVLLVTDSSTSSFVFTGSATESTTAADSATSTSARNGAATESLTATETLTNVATMPAALTESAPAVDVPANTLVALAGLTESASAQDSSTRSFVTSGALTEVFSATDASTRSWATSASITESVTTVDAIVRTLIAAAAVTEPVTAAELLTVQGTFNVATMEPVLLVETQTSSRAIRLVMGGFGV